MRVLPRCRTANLPGFNRALYHLSLEDMDGPTGLEPASPALMAVL